MGSVVGYASLVLVIFLVIAGFRGFRDLGIAQAREDELVRAIERGEDDIEQLERQVERLRNDPVLLERLARDELGMVRPGEVVVIVGPEVQAPGSTTSRPPAEPSSDPREPESP